MSGFMAGFFRSNRFLVLALLLASCGGGGGGGGGTPAPPPPPPPTLQSITVSPTALSVELGTLVPNLTATGSYSDGSTADVTAAATWSSLSPSIATTGSGGTLTGVSVGSATIHATIGSVFGAASVTVTSPGHFLVKDAGLFTQFEERGSTAGYYSGQVIQTWNTVDPVVGTTVAAEVGSQLDAMKAMGVNTITVQLRTSDATYTGNFTPPDCNEPPVLGLQFPQPTATELANLPLLFDAVGSRGMRIWLSLINTHMEQQPPTNSQTWIGAILGAVGQHPALDLVLFDGTPYTVPSSGGTQVCGTPAEGPLWLGPGSTAPVYVQWAMGYAMSLGVPAHKLSAEAIVGSYFVESGAPAGSNATGGHLWSPIAVEKTIFDNLGIPASQRTYALSFYEHRKCSDAGTQPCTDTDPHSWADQTLQYVTGVVGSGPRIVAPEMGDLPPVDPVQWKTQWALESLAFLLPKYGVEGGSFWRWTSFVNSEDANPTLATPVKLRGVAYTYTPVQKEVLDLAGFHLPLVPNGSFEGSVVQGVPASWTASGNGSVAQYLLTVEAGQPEVPSRGVHALRMVTGSTAATVAATSVPIPVTAGTLYTTTANLRFAWTGDPAVGTGPSASRPQVFIDILYFQPNGAPSAVLAQTSQAYFQEDSTSGFATFPLQYTTPSDAAFVQIRFGASQNGLASPITLDVDNVR